MNRSNTLNIEGSISASSLISSITFGHFPHRIPLKFLRTVHILTEEQKSKKLSNLLQKMKKDGLVDVRGIAVNSEWYIKTKD